MGHTTIRFLPGHSAWTRPDRAMSHERHDPKPEPHRGLAPRVTPGMRQIFKRAAAKKRRQRDRMVIDVE